MKKESPSIDAWLKEAKAHESAPMCGMYLTHNGTVRQTAKAKVRYGAENTEDVTGMIFSYDEEKVNAVISDTYKMDGIYYIKVWLNEGQLQMGDDIMYVLIAAISVPEWWMPCSIWWVGSKMSASSKRNFINNTKLPL